MFAAMFRSHRLSVVLSALMALGLGASPVLADAPPRAPSYADDVCYEQTSTQEQVNGIPAQVLTAISMVESGRWNERRGARIAWPWTVTNGKDGRFFQTKAEAIAHVRALQARGETNIDVGCMQINLYYHGDAFPTLDKAFEPAANVRYAVGFLTRLHAETGSWTRAVARYHSATPVYAERYMNKFRIAWQEAQENAVVAGLPPVHDIVARAAEIEAARQAERQRLEAEQEVERAAARAFAESWRAERLREYRAQREARAATRGTRDAS